MFYWWWLSWFQGCRTNQGRCISISSHQLWAANASSHCKHRLQLPMAALCLSWNVGHYLRRALIATLVAVSGNLAASEDGAFWHAACMLPSCYSWKKWCHNTIAGAILIHLAPQRFEEMPSKLRYLKAIKNCSIMFHQLFSHIDQHFINITPLQGLLWVLLQHW